MSYQEDPYVMHPLCIKANKVRKFKEDGLWFLKWQQHGAESVTEVSDGVLAICANVLGYCLIFQVINLLVGNVLAIAFVRR